MPAAPPPKEKPWDELTAEEKVARVDSWEKNLNPYEKHRRELDKQTVETTIGPFRRSENPERLWFFASIDAATLSFSTGGEADSPLQADGWLSIGRRTSRGISADIQVSLGVEDLEALAEAATQAAREARRRWPAALEAARQKGWETPAASRADKKEGAL